MILQVKIYLIATLYFFGALFILLFPPRNYVMSGAKMRKVRSTGQKLRFTKYMDYNSLLHVAENMARDDPEIARVVHLTPRTANNQSILSLELQSDRQSTKPGILVIGTINGMTWGTPNAVIELTDKLLYDSNYQTPFFNDYDWYMIPLVNPDGLNFTQSLRNRKSFNVEQWCRNTTASNTTRPSFWYKNVEKEMSNDTCFGANINRNFAYHWQDDVHKTPVRCSQYYPGDKPFSTAEAIALRTYVHQLGDRIHLAIHLHASFEFKKEYILYPWRYSLRQHSNYHTLQAIGEYAARNSRLSDGRLYEVHQGSSDARVAGTLSDYLAGVVGTELVYVVKPYHEMYPNYSDRSALELYVSKSMTTILSLVRGWRKSTKLNTLSFYGRDVEF
ncbi:PREDICTED: zinc carboxypeptidase-like [Papilio polytes]|uniref:zinc carboxypeptidase-like n=1 Tax=Papilio polytes TaxID=76194 RepID=UPI00067650C4|nr:PREDICTED: zinc carboxypeptidase-like [Papilio polytes]